MILIEEKNKYEFDDLFNYIIETEDKFLNRKLNSNICFGGKGGGGSKQQDIAPTLKPYVTDVLSRAKGEFQQPYQQYPGERVVGFTPQELAAQGGIQQMAGQYGLASMAPGLTSSASYYQPAYGYLGQTGEALGVGAGALAESGDIQRGAAREIGLDEVGKFALTGEDIQKYMDPYQQAVTDIDKRQARQDALQTAQAIGAKSTGMGAFGGSRQAILESQAASDLGTRLADIQTRGSQAAYQQALQTAAQQQQVGLGQAAQQRAREQQLGAGIAGLGGQYGQLASGLGALSGQYGALGQQALGQGYRELGYLSGVGEAQRGMGQQRADVAYQDFREAREYPTQQLERYAGMAFGVPSGYLSRPQATPSGFQQAVGGIATLGGLGQGLRFFKEGGDISKGGLSTVYRKPGGTVSPQLYREGAKMVPITGLSNQSLISMFGAEAEKEKERRGLKTVKEKQRDRSKPIEYQAEKEKPSEVTPEKEGSELALLYAAQSKNITDRESSLEDLKKLTQEAFKFDKDKKAKSIKAQQGFDIAALGMELMSKPLEEIDPAYIRQLGVSGKELDELDQEEAMSKYKAKAAEYGLEETAAKIQALKSPFSVTPGQINQAAALITGASSEEQQMQLAQKFYREAYNAGLNEDNATQYVLSRIDEVNTNPSSFINQKKGLASTLLGGATKRQDALKS